MGKKLKIIFASIGIAIMAVFVVLCIAVSKKNDTIRTLKKEIVKNEIVIDSLQHYNRELAELNGIEVRVEFNLKSTNVLGITNNTCTNIAKEISQLTRKEILDSLSKR